MRWSFLPAIALACGLTIPHRIEAQPAPALLRVTRDPQNVVASRLLGDWILDTALTTRLAGTTLPKIEEIPEPARKISFRSDTTVLGQIPEAQLVKMRTMPFSIVLAGTVSINDKRDLPFMVITLNGTSHVMFWVPTQSRPNDRFANGESFIATIGPAREPFNDILMIGGDFNNQPFTAFSRAGVRIPTP